MIIGEIRRYLRDNNTIRVTRSMRDLAYKALQVKERIFKDTQKEATIEEIAKELKEPKEDIWKQNYHYYKILCLDGNYTTPLLD